MTRQVDIIIDPAIIPEAAAIAGSEAALWAALGWAANALTPGEINRLREQIESPDQWRQVVQEMVDRWRAFQAMTGCDDPAAAGGNVTTPAPQEPRR